MEIKAEDVFSLYLTGGFLTFPGENAIIKQRLSRYLKGVGRAAKKLFCVGYPKRNLNGGNLMNTRTKLTRMVTTALLMALIVLLGLTPLGFINVGVIYITFLCVPVIIGALAMGQKTGLILGFTMGCVSLYTGLRAPSALVAPILQKNMIWLILLCFVPRLLVPLAALGMKKLLQGKMEKVSLPAAAAAGSLTNTILYLGMLLLFYVLLGIENPTLLATLGTITLTAGLPEAAAAALVSTPILIALKKAGLIRRLQ